MKTLNVGVIGLGAIGQKHCQVLSEIRQANIVALADINEEVLEKTAKTYRGGDGKITACHIQTFPRTVEDCPRFF